MNVHELPVTALSRVRAAAAIITAAALVMLAAGCGSSSTDDAAATTASARAAAVSCPDLSAEASGVPRQAIFAFMNLSSIDVTYTASPPDCTKWWGTAYPADYNGTEIPAMQAGDPPVRMVLQPTPFVTKVDMTDVRTLITFTRMDGSLLGKVMTALNWNKMALGIAPFNDGQQQQQQPAPNSTVVFAPGGKPLATVSVGPAKVQSVNATFTFTLRDYRKP